MVWSITSSDPCLRHGQYRGTSDASLKQTSVYTVRVSIARDLTMSVKDFLSREATFYRVHMTVFIFVPLVFSVIMYLCNGRFHIPYIDSLFMCYSAMTVTGLSTVNLSSMTAWQQVILYLLMACGDITVVSWVMVLVRMSVQLTR